MSGSRRLRWFRHDLVYFLPKRGRSPVRVIPVRVKQTNFPVFDSAAASQGRRTVQNPPRNSRFHHLHCSLELGIYRHRNILYRFAIPALPLHPSSSRWIQFRSFSNRFIPRSLCLGSSIMATIDHARVGSNPWNSNTLQDMHGHWTHLFIIPTVGKCLCKGREHHDLLDGDVVLGGHWRLTEHYF
jgi:hypothetical protein